MVNVTATPRRRLVRTLVLPAVIVAICLLGAIAPTPVQAVVPVRLEHVPLAAPPAGTFAAAGAVTSEVHETPPFAMVALALPGEVQVEVRTARGDGEWSSWTVLGHLHDEGPDPGSPEALAADAASSGTVERTHPLWTGPADRLQVRALDGDLTGAEAILIDPLGLDRSGLERARDALVTAWNGTPRDTANALAAQPDIVTRAEWGADESIVDAPPSYAADVDRMFVHHTVSSNGYSQAQAAATVRGVQAYHVNGNGWNDIGYNFLIDAYGTIYEGRAGGIDRAVIGAQAGGFNTGSSGVALLGTYTAATPGSAMQTALEQLVAWKADVHHFHPTGTSVAVSAGSSRYPEGQAVTLDNISGHRDVSTTTCPGDGPYNGLPATRTAVRERAGDLIVDQASDIVATRVIRGDPDVDRVTFAATLDPPGDWQIDLRGPDGDVVFRAQGAGAAATGTVDLAGSGWALGRYEWAVSADGRRTALGHLDLEPPVIEGALASPTLARADLDGALATPVAFSALLWPGATWQVDVTGPDGAAVYHQQGSGDRVDAVWDDGTAAPGTYVWTLTAEDAEPVSGSVEVRYDVLDRLADTDDPIAAAAAVSAATFDPGEATVAVIARHDVFADALSGGPLAGTEGPLLLTPSDGLDPRVDAELDRVLAPGATIHVLGGTAAVSPAVADQLAVHGTVVRLAGASRVATAAAVAEVVLDRSGEDRVMIARAGPDDAAPWADALSGGAYGAATGVPVMLTDTAGLSPETADAITRLGVTSAVVLGGTAAVSDAAMGALPSPTRMSGGDRTATAVAVAQQLWGADGTFDEVLLANGYDGTAWAWALAAAPTAARRGAPLLLTTPTHLAAPTAALLAEGNVRDGTVLGSAALVDPEVSYAASDEIRRGR